MNFTNQENPWNVKDPFLPMMTDYISFIGKRGEIEHRTTINACLFPLQNTETIIASDIDSDIKMVTMLTTDDAFISYDSKFKPQIGDFFVTENNEKYKVTIVNLNTGIYEITGRSI